MAVTRRQKKLNEIDEQKRKAKEAEEKAEVLKKEFEALVKQQEKERDDTKEQIEALCGDKYLCGLILTEEDLLNLLRLKFTQPKENIEIKFNLYIIEQTTE